MKIESQNFEYKGVLKVGVDATTTRPQRTLPHDVWVKAVGERRNGDHVFAGRSVATHFVRFVA